MLTYKLPSIVIIAHESCIVNTHIGVGKSEYGVTDDLLFGIVRGHVTQIWNLGTRSVSRERLKLETRNLA